MGGMDPCPRKKSPAGALCAGRSFAPVCQRGHQGASMKDAISNCVWHVYSKGGTMNKKSGEKSETEEFDIFELDQYRLDEEWVNQPKLYHRYAILLAQAEEDHERAKADKELTVAKLDKAIRSEPLIYDISKVTEGVVERTILLQGAYQHVAEVVIKAKRKIDDLKAMVRTVEHRKTALENLVYLQGQDYFSTPRAPKGTKERMTEVTKSAARKRVKGALND